MAIGIYVHIPYCIQRCKYCDFTTFKWDTILPPDEYLGLLKHEINSRSTSIKKERLQSVYFGGGTPSLVPADHIVSILNEIANVGFTIDDDTEITIEINPATLTTSSMDTYLSAGVNRFSLGAQSFKDGLLKLSGREHDSLDTRKTLDLLKSYDVNFSMDLLFALPTQSLKDVEYELNEFLKYDPPHISPYCLTIPKNHSMETNRASDKEQVEMFRLISSRLNQAGLLKYEISNFAKPGLESKHNLLYWQDQAYWGIGLSSHSYFPNEKHGVRFWNPKDISTYKAQAGSLAGDLPYNLLPKNQVEHLKLNEAITDFCHTQMRLSQGLSQVAVQQRFGPPILDVLSQRLEPLIKNGLVRSSSEHWSLTPEGETLSNLVFAELTILASEL